MNPAALRLRIHGRVQGVGFRYAALIEAERLGLQGWVRNRRDGSVEAVIRGSAAACEAFTQWARRGPRAARVDRVETRNAEGDELAQVGGGFALLPSD